MEKTEEEIILVIVKTGFSLKNIYKHFIDYLFIPYIRLLERNLNIYYKYMIIEDSPKGSEMGFMWKTHIGDELIDMIQVMLELEFQIGSSILSDTSTVVPIAAKKLLFDEANSKQNRHVLMFLPHIKIEETSGNSNEAGGNIFKFLKDVFIVNSNILVISNPDFSKIWTDAIKEFQFSSELKHNIIFDHSIMFLGSYMELLVTSLQANKIKDSKSIPSANNQPITNESFKQNNNQTSEKINMNLSTGHSVKFWSGKLTYEETSTSHIYNVELISHPESLHPPIDMTSWKTDLSMKVIGNKILLILAGLPSGFSLFQMNFVPPIASTEDPNATEKFYSFLNRLISTTMHNFQPITNHSVVEASAIMRKAVFDTRDRQAVILSPNLSALSTGQSEQRFLLVIFNERLKIFQVAVANNPGELFARK